MRKPLSIPDKNYLKIPNEFVDDWMTELAPSETVIFLIILRKTLGYQKSEDWISLSQFEAATGLSRPTVIKALKILQKKEMILTLNLEQKGVKFLYQLNIEPVKKIDQYQSSILTDTGKENLHTIYKRQKTSTAPDSFDSKAWLIDFSLKYKKTTTTDYTINYGKDNNIAKSLLRRAGGDIQKLNEMADNFFKWWDSDKFWKLKSPEPQMFLSKFNDVALFINRQKPIVVQEYVKYLEKGDK